MASWGKKPFDPSIMYKVYQKIYLLYIQRKNCAIMAGWVIDLNEYVFSALYLLRIEWGDERYEDEKCFYAAFDSIYLGDGFCRPEYGYGLSRSIYL